MSDTYTGTATHRQKFGPAPATEPRAPGLDRPKGATVILAMTHAGEGACRSREAADRLIATVREVGAVRADGRDKYAARPPGP